VVGLSSGNASSSPSESKATGEQYTPTTEAVVDSGLKAPR